jgi:hypothetical protein
MGENAALIKIADSDIKIINDKVFEGNISLNLKKDNNHKDMLLKEKS